MNPEDRLKQMLNRAKGEDRVTESKWNEFATSARRSIRIQRFAMAGLAVFLLGAGVVGAATVFDDGPGRPVQPVGPTNEETVEPPDTSPTAAPSPDSSEFPNEPPPEPREVELWLVDPKTDTLWWGTTINPGIEGDPTDQPDNGEGQEPVEFVIERLLDGPGSPDAEVGAETEVPEDTELLGIEIVDNVARIDLSSEFLSDDPSNLSRKLRIAQVVFQATQVEGIDQVQILVDGEPVHGPASRDDHGESGPPIAVNTPKNGSEHSSPLVVSGTANVFEATVSIELEIHGKGKDVVIGTFATATCGSGCRGEFSEEIPFEVDKPTDATLHVYEESAEDGSRLHSVQLSLRLLPSE